MDRVLAELGRWPDGLRDYQWWYVQKDVDLFTHSPVFTGVYSYEHSMTSPGGHRNVLFLNRGAPLRMIDRTKGYDAPDNSPPAMWAFWEKYVLSQPGQKSVIVPHTFGAGPLADWNWPNARFDCLLEMYQGARGSYEALCVGRSWRRRALSRSLAAVRASAEARETRRATAVKAALDRWAASRAEARGRAAR
jgi:hypothetical protein